MSSFGNELWRQTSLREILARGSFPKRNAVNWLDSDDPEIGTLSEIIFRPLLLCLPIPRRAFDVRPTKAVS